MAEAVQNGLDTEAQNAPAVGVLSQYVKDLSVENPNAPASYNFEGQPNIDVQVNIGAQAVGEEVHEVVLNLAVNARHDEGVSFAVELSYAGLFGLRNFPEDAAHHFIYAEAPRIIFPFARRILADAVRDAGYPPLMLEPIDFNALYFQQKAAQQAEMEAQPAGEA